MEAVQELSPAAAGKRNLDLVLDGVAAMRARQEFPSGITPQACGNFLKSIGFQVVAEACTEEDLDSRDRPVRLHVKGKAGSLAVTGVAPSERLDAAFSRPAWFYDSARVEDYAFPFEQWRKETVTLRAIPGREAKLACEDRRNSVFEVKCARKPGPLGMVMTREVLIHSGNYPASSLAALHRDLSALGAATPALYSQP